MRTLYKSKSWNSLEKRLQGELLRIHICSAGDHDNGAQKINDVRRKNYFTKQKWIYSAYFPYVKTEARKSLLLQNETLPHRNETWKQNDEKEKKKQRKLHLGDGGARAREGQPRCSIIIAWQFPALSASTRRRRVSRMAYRRRAWKGR